MDATKRPTGRIVLSVLIFAVVGALLLLLLSWRVEIAALSAPLRWTLGMAFSAIVGAFTTWAFVTLLRAYLSFAVNPLERGSREIKRIPPALTGVLERLFFTAIVGLNLSGAAIAMIGWITVKMFPTWQRGGVEDQDDTPIRWAYASLLAGLVSMLFAMIGGLICLGRLP